MDLSPWQREQGKKEGELHSRDKARESVCLVNVSSLGEKNPPKQLFLAMPWELWNEAKNTPWVLLTWSLVAIDKDKVFPGGQEAFLRTVPGQ